MKHSVFIPLDIQLFAEGGEEETANKNVEVSKDMKTDNSEKDNKSVEKKYTDDELNAITRKNEQKALARQLKDLGIDDIEKAKSILAKAKQEEEESKSQDDKTKELTRERDEAKLEAINSKIENALLRKGVNEKRVERAVRLIEKTSILGNDGKVDNSKLLDEVENVIKDFPELISKQQEEFKGFKIGSDGKEDSSKDELSEMRKIMGLK